MTKNQVIRKLRTVAKNYHKNLLKEADKNYGDFIVFINYIKEKKFVEAYNMIWNLPQDTRDLISDEIWDWIETEAIKETEAQ